MDINDIEKWHFALTEETCNYLLKLVLEGKKKATTSSLWGYEIEGGKIPETGTRSIITDWNGISKCLVKTTKVRIMPYKDITFEIAVLEGEDDSLESWRKNHEKFFKEEGRLLGYEFSEDMPVIFEEFEVVERY